MDPVSDIFIRLKNATRAKHEVVYIPYSRLKHEIAKMLERVRMVKGVEKKGKRVRKILEIALFPSTEKNAIHDVRLISKPSRRLFQGYRSFGHSRRGGVLIVSTPRGIMSAEEAKKEKVGGQLMAEIF